MDKASPPTKKKNFVGVLQSCSALSLSLLDFEDGTDRLSEKVVKELPLYTA